VARILIAEDDDMDRLLLGTIIEGSHHEVFYATDGKRALAIYEEKGIDVVVTDLHMPHGDGLDFIGTLAALFPSAPVIAVSGKGQELLQEAIVRGARAALSKPVDADELLEAIKNALPDP
jgi:CheY-like chemotaxis protein